MRHNSPPIDLLAGVGCVEILSLTHPEFFRIPPSDITLDISRETSCHAIMNGKEFIESRGLKAGEYTGYEGQVGFTDEDLARLESVVFTADELERMAAEKPRDLPVTELISDEFIKDAAQLGGLDFDAIRGDLASEIDDALMEVADDSNR